MQEVPKAVSRKSLLALALAFGVGTPALAANFEIGEIHGQFDSSLSIGASWATEDADNHLIDASNGGAGLSSTGDDGRLNFKKGETFSKIFKGVHDLELRYEDSSVFVRGKYWYDFELKDESRPWKDIDDSGRDRSAKSSGAEFLDVFFDQRYELGGQRGNVRIGKQVVSWGESTFIGNSLNVINPVDISALRRPGSEVKEALIPTNMLYVSQGLTDSLNLEAFYQLEWKSHVLDNCGTFFGNDVAPPGCTDNYTVSFGRDVNQLVTALQPAATADGFGYGVNGREGIFVPRLKDKDARDSGQFGVNLRWLADDTEYGAYFINYHSRAPQLSTLTPTGQTAFLSSPSFNDALTTFGGDAAAAYALSAGLGNGGYRLEYPEDIRLYGLTFATTLPTGTAWSGEVSFRENAPLAINSGDYTNAIIDPMYRALTGTPASPTIDTAEGETNQGWRRKPVTQVQSTFIHIFDPMLGANSLTVVGEVGMTHITDLEAGSEMRYGRDSVFGEWGLNGKHGFFTANSWGYRGYAELAYENLIAGVNVRPNLFFSHDVEGYGPVFNEGSKSVSVGLDADLRNTYTASLSYNTFFDGEYNTNVDRDYVALSFGVNF